MCSDHTFLDSKQSLPSFDEIVAFHGHSCLGLASGYQMAIAAMTALDVSRPEDEELVAVAETDSCSIDAIQVVTGCTAGKGNLIIHDFGKHGVSFYARDKKKAVRVMINLEHIASHKEISKEMRELRPKISSETATPKEEERFYSLMNQAVATILSARPEDIVTIQEIAYDPPKKAQIFQSITCESCGESVADAKTRVIDGKRLCIPCADKR
ncbi:MAG: FmdE family protein [Euryarchaeota archaeon]|nr:FmdE family protein [Euryarchaeota archaeon]